MSQKLNLVTGACGFCGSHVLKHLLDNGEEVIATDLDAAFENPKVQFVFKHIGLDLQHPRVRVIPADLTQAETLKPLFQHPITHVFHTASLYNYSAPMDQLVKINIDGFSNLMAASRPADLQRFIHWSTCGVFGHPYPLTDKRRGNVPFTEESPSPKTEPFGVEQPTGTYLVNDYCVTKWKQEQMAWRAHREQGLPLTVIRPAPLYGPGSDYGHGGIIMSVHKGLLSAIPWDARNYITISVHVHDLARFAYWISRQDNAIGEDFNVLDDSVISHGDFIRYIALLLGHRIREFRGIKLTRVAKYALRLATAWRWVEKRYGIPRPRMFEVGSASYIGSSYWISNRKTKDWGFAYRYPDVREGLRDTIEWFHRVGWL